MSAAGLRVQRVGDWERNGAGVGVKADVRDGSEVGEVWRDMGAEGGGMGN